MTPGWAAVLFRMLLAAASVGAAAPQPSQADAGRKVYDREKCAQCHQIAHKGNSRFPLDGVASRLTADQIRRWITDTAAMEAAQRPMPAIRMSARTYRLKPADLEALVVYLRTLK